MYNLHNPKPPKWANNVEAATQKLWSIDAGGMGVGRAIAICNAITANARLPIPLRKRAENRRLILIVGRQRVKLTDTTHTVIQLKA